MITPPHNLPRPRPERAFTLAELLVVMAIIAIVSTITVVAVKGIAKDARLSSARNAVVAALDNGRALAMKRNAVTMVVFAARWNAEVPGERQVSEIVIAEWTGETERFDSDGDGLIDLLIDRFVPISDVSVRALAPGIKVAGPEYGRSTLVTYRDDIWVTQPEFQLADPTNQREVPGRMIAVMFGPDGTLVTENPKNQIGAWLPFIPGVVKVDYASFIDFNNNGVQDLGTDIGPPGFWEYDEPLDETYINIVPFLSVYDDDLAREVRRFEDWSNTAQGIQNYEDDLTGPNGFISTLADRIHFNRYTGVAMR